GRRRACARARPGPKRLQDRSRQAYAHCDAGEGHRGTAMIGQPVNRVDGPLKVSGHATYSYEEWGAGQPLYGFIVQATIGRGRITKLDTARAEQAPGVRYVLTHRNAPPQHEPDMSLDSPFYWSYPRALPVLSGPEVRFVGEPVGLVVAATF